ncbi:MAG: hypothetical protein KJ736_08030 [Candidatus Omnitrophica bacterium]|nr:hypothetical protein [Candidatus Omnitrophota bacterium]
MDRLYEIEDILEELAEEIEPHLQLIPEFFSKIKDTDKPLSVFSMSTFFPKIESIRLGIFEVAKIEEYYSLNILFRSLIEHFVRAQYIWMKTVENKNDEIGIDYWVFGQDQENIDYAKALQKSYSTIGINPEVSPIETLKKIGVISKDKSQNKIRKKVDQFKYSNMIHFIANRMKSKENSEAPILFSIFPRYSELSSCVHGGPDSVGSYQKGPKAMKEIVEMATFSSLHIRWLSNVLFYQYDKSIEPLCQITRKYLHKFTGHNNSIQWTSGAAGAAPSSR